MVYVDPKNLGYKLYWERWANNMPSEEDRKELNRLFYKYVPQCIDLILEGVKDGKQGEKLKSILTVTNLNMVGGVQCTDGLPSHNPALYRLLNYASC